MSHIQRRQHVILAITVLLNQLTATLCPKALQMCGTWIEFITFHTQSWLFQLIPSHVHPLDESSSFSRTWATRKSLSCHRGRHPYNFGCNFKAPDIKLPPPSIFESSGRIKEAAAESNIPKWNILQSDNVWNKTKEHLCSAVSATLPHCSCLICVLESVWFGITCLMLHIQEKTVWMKNTGSTKAEFAL